MTTMFFGFAMEITEITNSFGNCQWNSLLQHFYALIFLGVKAMETNSGSAEAMKH
jgi:hypothetical protein